LHPARILASYNTFLGNNPDQYINYFFTILRNEHLNRNFWRLVAIMIWGSMLQAGIAEIVVDFRMDLTDLDGKPLTEISIGDQMLLNVYTQDLRNIATGGVFAAYLDVHYDNRVLEVNGPINHGSLYVNGRSGSFATPNLIDDIGGFSNGLSADLPFAPVGVGEYLVFSVPINAIGLGNFNLVGRPANNSPFYDVLVYGENGPVQPEDIAFSQLFQQSIVQNAVRYGAISGSIQPVPEPTTIALVSTAIALLFLSRFLQKSLRKTLKELLCSTWSANCIAVLQR